jgi:protein-arginine kinase activator protein McsA
MKCEKCKKRNATCLLTVKISNKKEFLCKICASNTQINMALENRATRVEKIGKPINR